MMIANPLRMDDMQGLMRKMKWDIAMTTSILSLMVTPMHIGTLTNSTIPDCGRVRCKLRNYLEESTGAAKKVIDVYSLK